MGEVGKTGKQKALEALREYGEGCDFAPFEDDFSSYEQHFRAMEKADQLRKEHLSDLSEGELMTTINDHIEHSALQDLEGRDHIPDPEAGRVLDRIREASKAGSKQEHTDALREARNALEDVSEGDREWLREQLSGSWSEKVGLSEDKSQDQDKSQDDDKDRRNRDRGRGRGGYGGIGR